MENAIVTSQLGSLATNTADELNDIE